MLDAGIPYPGLRPFGEAESHLFFGRDAHTDRLLEILAAQHFLAVIGPSGSGKSSLVRAGLLPALPLGAIGTGDSWRKAILRPGIRPLTTLAKALLEPAVLGRELRDGGSELAGPPDAREVARVETELRRGPLGLIDLVSDTRAVATRFDQPGTPDPDFNLLVLVDQFEELFTYADADPRGEDESEAFVNLLLRSREEHASRIFVVITMRTDFLGSCTRFLHLPDAINRAQYLTPRLTREQMSAAIVSPARSFGGEVTPELVTELVNAVQADQDELPVLQHALARMWQIASAAQNDTITLTLDDLSNVGGIQGALPRHADELFVSLGAEDKGRCEWLFRAITEQRSADAGGQRVRRPRGLGWVGKWSRQDWKSYEPILRLFGSPQAGFLNYNGQPEAPAEGSDTIVDIVHEALIRRWVRLQQWIEAEARAARQFAGLLDRARLVNEGQASVLEGGDLARAIQWRSAGLLCEPSISAVESLCGPEMPTEPWAARYALGPASVGVNAFETVKTLIAQSASARTSAKRTQVAKVSLVGVLFLVAGALFWRQTEMSGGMTDLEARALFSMSRTPAGDRLQEHEDRALSLVAAARPEVRSRFLSQWFNQSVSDTDDIPTPAALRAAVGLDEKLAEQTKAALAAAYKAKPSVWVRLRVMAAPSLGDEVTVPEVVAAMLAESSEDETASDALEGTLAALVRQSKPEDLPARLKEVLSALLSQRELADEGLSFNAVLRGWGAGVRFQGGAIPATVYAEMDRVLASTTKTDEPVLQQFPVELAAARMRGTVEDPIVQRLGASMAAPMLRYGQLKDEEARRYAGWAWRNRDESASRPELVLAALAREAPMLLPQMEEPRRRDARSRLSPYPLLQAGVSPRLPEFPEADAPMDEKRRQDLLMLYARAIDSQSVSEELNYRRRLREIESNPTGSKWHVLTQIAAQVDGYDEHKSLLQMFSERRRGQDDEVLDRYLTITLLHIGQQRSTDLLRSSGMDRRTNGSNPFVSPWKGNPVDRELKVYHRDSFRSNRDQARLWTLQDQMRLGALARHLDQEDATRVGRKLHTELLAAADRDEIERLRNLIFDVLKASNEPAREALGKAVVGALDRDDALHVGRIAKGFNVMSFSLLPADSRAALVAGLSKAWAGAHSSYEYVALAEAAAALPPKSRAQLLAGGGAALKPVEAALDRADQRGTSTAHIRSLRIAAFAAQTMEPQATVAIVERHTRQIAQVADASTARERTRALVSFAAQLSPSSAAAVVDAFAARRPSAGIRELRVWMEVTQPLLLSIPMTDERVRQWLTLSRLPMADHALIAAAVQPPVNETVPVRAGPPTLRQLAGQVGLKLNAELKFDAGQEARVAAGANRTAPRAESDTSGAVGRLAKPPSLLQELEVKRDRALEDMEDDPFDLRNLTRLMLAYNGLSNGLSDADQHQQALETATQVLALSRYLYLHESTARKPQAGSNLLGSMSAMTTILLDLGQYEKAQALNSEHLSLATKLLETEPTDEEMCKRFLAAISHAATLNRLQSRYAANVESRQQSLLKVREFMARASLDTGQRAAWNVKLLEAINSLTLAQREAGRLARALETSREGLALAFSIAKRNPDDKALKAIGKTHYNFGQVLEQIGRWSAASGEYEMAGRLADQTKDEEQALFARSRFARSLAYVERHDESVTALLAVLQQAEKQMEARKNQQNAETVTVQYQRLGEVYMLKGQAPDAVASLKKGDEVLSSFLDETTKALIGPTLVSVRCALAEALMGAGQSSQAGQVLDSAIQLLDQLMSRQGSGSSWSVYSMRVQHVRGKVELALGNVALANTALQAAARAGTVAFKAAPDDAILREQLNRIDQDLRKVKPAVATR